MKYLGLVVILCATAGLSAGPASAFDIQGENASLENEAGARQSGAQFSSPVDQFLTPDYTQGSSLALPYIGNNDSSTFISDYGNMIAIPSPGVDRPAPIWSYR